MAGARRRRARGDCSWREFHERRIKKTKKIRK